MDQEIKTLIMNLERGTKFRHVPDGSEGIEPDVEKTDAIMSEAAMALKAIFDPENQPSQFGTTLA